MELTQQHTLLEELIMTPKMDSNKTPFPNDFFPNAWSLASLDQPPDLCLPAAAAATYPSLVEIISPPEFGSSFPLGPFQPFLEALTFADQFTSFYDVDDMTSPPSIQQDHATKDADANTELIGLLDSGITGMTTTTAKPTPNMDIIIHGEKKSRPKKPNGMPSKNLMAERRRRKRLNDRLSMLRSIVPKISKMDRTSILGDTIDYTRELLDKIHKLREEGMDENLNRINLIANKYLKELKPNEMLMRNPPKFDVERGTHDTRVEVCCTAKPGLLISTLSTLDALGLDIQQCVISCFNDFSLQASCYEVAEHRSLVSTDDVKQALFVNAGYGGRCL